MEFGYNGNDGVFIRGNFTCREGSVSIVGESLEW